jgi:hypothetical protein
MDTKYQRLLPVEYNYRNKAELEQKGEIHFTHGESHGLSVFLRDGGSVFHTYSAYARGLELLDGTYKITLTLCRLADRKIGRTHPEAGLKLQHMAGYAITTGMNMLLWIQHPLAIPGQCDQTVPQPIEIVITDSQYTRFDIGMELSKCVHPRSGLFNGALKKPLLWVKS